MTADRREDHVSLLISGRVAHVTLERRAHRNALNQRMRALLAARIAEAAATPEIAVIVLAGGGDAAFAAGADIEELSGLSPDESMALSASIAALHAQIEAVPQPVIAAVRGWCLGGGLELALAADIRIAGASARFGLPEITLGILPGGGGMARLTRTIGAAAARHLCFTGAIIDAPRAFALNLVSEVHADDVFDTRVQELAAMLAGFSRPALAALKEAFRRDDGAALPQAIAEEARIGAALYGSAEQRAAMTAFLTRRARRPDK